MPIPRKKLKEKFYFSVEGETEKWYLEWLARTINASSEASRTVSFDIRVDKDPVHCIKCLSITTKTEVWHLCDYESDGDAHQTAFRNTLKQLKKAKQGGKDIKYFFGYCNLTFDLWILLHKGDAKSIDHRKKYVDGLNRAYHETFSDMSDFKHEDNFKRCLSKLRIDDVKKAITRAKKIMTKNEELGYTELEYCGYHYYRENPSLAIWEIIEKILIRCGLAD